MSLSVLLLLFLFPLGRAEADVKLLKQRLEDNEKQIEEQHSHFMSESLRLRNQLLTQNKKLKEQGDALVELQKKEIENAQRFAEQEVWRL